MAIDDLDFSKLLQLVLKCNHDSGSVVICKDKTKFDFKEARRKLNRCLKRNYYYLSREWPYKNVKPKIVCEKYLLDNENLELNDYRFLCCDGNPKFIMVDFNTTDKTKKRRNLYDLEWNLLGAEISYPRELGIKCPKPNNLEKMINLSKRLSKGIPHVRVDLYSIKDKIYFGEMTFYHQSGTAKINPKEFEIEMGNWIELSKTKK
ncbi:ATP-grasp fold amidoligase family protein [Methanococcus maripaludis]|uniref:Teichuronopeptide biosynthesis TupA-like protein n=1 Tax=Methanococcus maripaludis TaxID=39152 RepID=A0A7J9PFS5_METMI|nr:ATP-grasp fold amidoligase family protein [Methanococcus maripaludis]MBA2862113.1 hypothetical protein [Methanococcus maripaludis]